MEEKRAARTVIIDRDYEIFRTAIISVRNGEYFKIPGGGIEEGESEEEAAIREAREEAGCDVTLLKEIGRSSFTDEKSILHSSICFLAERKSNGIVSFDEWEKSNDFKVDWVSLKEADRLFRSSKTNDPFGKKINERDHAFLLESRKLL